VILITNTQEKELLGVTVYATYSLGYALESVTLLILGLNKANFKLQYSPFKEDISRLANGGDAI
jgi:hypothetical protein